jgi:hypothetical protein
MFLLEERIKIPLSPLRERDGVRGNKVFRKN